MNLTLLNHLPIRDRADLARFEEEMTLDERLPERSIFDVFIGAAERAPERTAITMLMTGARDERPRRVNYRELLGLVRRAANLFASLGASPGASGARGGVATMLPALVETHATLWGAATAGFAVPLNFLLQPDDRLVFGEARRDTDIAAYFHTGGTTGTPRLVANTHRGQLVAAFGGAVLGGLRETDTLTATLPLFHVGGTVFCALSTFMAGASLLVMSPGGLRNPAMVQGFWRLAAQHRATLVGGVPTSVGAVLETPLDGVDLSGVRAGFTGAASLPLAIGERFREVTGCGLHEVYGMTEASGVIAIDAVDGAGGSGSVGWALPYTRVRVRRQLADGTLGEDCRDGEVGIITVAGPHVSPGYLDPAHDAGVFVDDALNTGDLGYTDGAGRLHIAGRAKDLIIRSGHNIDPLMIENAMAEHPAVALAAAVGMPDAYAGELPVCYITLRPGASTTQDELQAHAQRTLGERPAWPKAIHVVDAIPLTSVGKIYKPQLRCDAAARVVTRIVCEQLGIREAQVVASEGGRRGMRLRVALPHSASESAADVAKALSSFVFESEVVVG
jgi:fatty-acyl-CoA synthase